MSLTWGKDADLDAMAARNFGESAEESDRYRKPGPRKLPWTAYDMCIWIGLSTLLWLGIGCVGWVLWEIIR